MIIIIKKWKRKKYIQEENNLKNLLLVEISLKIVTSSRDHRINGTINHKIRREVRMLDPCTNRELEWLRASFRSGSRTATHKSSKHAICTVRSARSPPRKQTSTSNLHIISTPGFV